MEIFLEESKFISSNWYAQIIHSRCLKGVAVCKSGSVKVMLTSVLKKASVVIFIC